MLDAFGSQCLPAPRSPGTQRRVRVTTSSSDDSSLSVSLSEACLCFSAAFFLSSFFSSFFSSLTTTFFVSFFFTSFGSVFLTTFFLGSSFVTFSSFCFPFTSLSSFFSALFSSLHSSFFSPSSIFSFLTSLLVPALGRGGPCFIRLASSAARVSFSYRQCTLAIAFRDATRWRFGPDQNPYSLR
uniref:(northern house mosquito) hypothetical protein n=1 Tax=Culex pipiens TaxID=7175 RepID=A0A8D8NSY3_CULPI